MTRVVVLFILVATPASAHHEMVVAASVAPLAWGMVTITIAGLAAWRRRMARRKKRD